MATTKIWPVRDSLKRLVDYAGNPEKTEYRDLRQALHYAENGEKTVSEDERFCFVTGVGCNAKTAYEEMTAVKRRFGKTGGNVAYHGYESFLPGEVTPEQCHEIGVRLAKKLWGKNYQVLVATHLDKEHLHNHFLINSVSFVNGKKFNDDMRAYYRMREESDALCREYELSIVRNPKGKTPRSIYFAEKNGEPTKFNLMREAIDTALKISSNPQDFRQALRDMGYFLNDDPNRKYATLKRIGSEKAVRLFRLGEDYDFPRLGERLQENYYRFGSQLYGRYLRIEAQSFQPAREYPVRGSLTKTKKIGGFRGLYLHYCYLLGILPKNSQRCPLSPEMREECRKLEEFSRQVRLICREKFDTTADVQRFIDNKNGEMKTLSEARDKCYNRLRRCDDPETIAEIRKERDKLTAAISDCRKEIKTAQNIIDRSKAMHANMKAELAMQTEKRERMKAYQNKTRQSERSYER